MVNFANIVYSLPYNLSTCGKAIIFTRGDSYFKIFAVFGMSAEVT